MKKILLISDTHGYIDDKILSYCKSADEVWHAGDIGNIEVVDKIKELKPLKGVYGNIDNKLIRNEFPLGCIKAKPIAEPMKGAVQGEATTTAKMPVRKDSRDSFFTWAIELNCPI